MRVLARDFKLLEVLTKSRATAGYLPSTHDNHTAALRFTEKH